jgi:hypothetical protein
VTFLLDQMTRGSQSTSGRGALGRLSRDCEAGECDQGEGREETVCLEELGGGWWRGRPQGLVLSMHGCGTASPHPSDSHKHQ